MKLDNQAAELLETYFAGDPSPETIEALEAWLRQDKANARLLAEYGLIDQLVAHEQKNQDAASIYAALLEAEEAAETILVDPTASKPIHIADPRPDTITFKQACSALGNFAVKGIRNKAGLITSVAALLVVGVVLTVVMLGGGDTPAPNSTASQGPSDSGSAIETTNIVATLTATHDAAWSTDSAKGALAPGSALHSNQTLTLTQGFAEITTEEGAVVILEAPATIELINENALHLLTGRLVGICETESSKGFLVRTPEVDVIDLGTRFGVDATKSDTTEVHVFEGSVQVERPAIGTTPVQQKTLEQGQAIVAHADSAYAAFVVIAAAPARFTAELETIWVGGTGKGLVSGDIDPGWRITEVDTKPITEHGEMTVWSHPDHEVGLNDSKWVRVNSALNPPEKRDVLFTCVSLFEVPEDIELEQYKLVIRARADNAIRNLYINGHQLDVPRNQVGVGPEWLTWTLTEHFKHGNNEITIHIKERLPKNNKPNSSGVRAELELIQR